MTIKTRDVHWKLTYPNGSPAYRAKIIFAVTVSGTLDDEVVVVRTIEGVADVNGEGTTPLVPNVLMDSGSQYVVSARLGADTILLQTNATVPDGDAAEVVELTA